MICLDQLTSNIENSLALRAEGKVVASKGSVLVAKIPDIAIGDCCSIRKRDGNELICSVIGFENDYCFLAPFDCLEGLPSNAKVSTEFKKLKIPVGDFLLGKILDPLGNIYDQKLLSTNTNCLSYSVQQKAHSALDRRAVNQQFFTGIASIDLFTPLAEGQRLGLFSGPGAGKSTLLGMLCKNAEYDVVVIGLIGERAREVKEFIDNTLEQKNKQKSVLVVSTSDESSYRRFLAAQSATTIAEYFRKQGKKVLLLIDSLTRAARALRDISLAAGELPVRQGYTPTVYAELPKLTERAGNSDKGSITAIYTILTQNDEGNDAFGEEVKSLLDGHIILSDKIAVQGIRPAIDISKSISRLSSVLWTEQQSATILLGRKIISRLQHDKDLILLGGNPDPELRAALAVEQEIHSILNQSVTDKVVFDERFSKLYLIINKFNKVLCNL